MPGPFTKEVVDTSIDEQYNNEPNTNTGWDDLTTSLIGRRLASNAGTVDYNWAENSISFSPSGDITDVNDCVNWNVQKPHGAKDDSVFKLHMHWEQTDATTREFKLRYRIQENNSAKTTAWTEVTIDTNTNNVFSYTSGTLNQITRLADIDWSNVSLSSTVQFRMTRSDATAGVVDVTFVDGHVEYDQARGSAQEYVKEPA